MNYLNKKTVEDIDVAGKHVLVRCDFNVPMKDGVITDTKRIVGALPTIKYLVDHNAKVILCSHMGRPHNIFNDVVKLDKKEKKKIDAMPEAEQAEATAKALEAAKGDVKKFSLAPVAAELSKLLGKEVIMAKDVVGPDAKAKAAALKDGEVLMLENVRFHAEETKNDPDFAKALASMAEIYVNDAFALHTVHMLPQQALQITSRLSAATSSRSRFPSLAARPRTQSARSLQSSVARKLLIS